LVLWVPIGTLNFINSFFKGHIPQLAGLLLC
jgi:hypothetical protein